MLLLQIGHASFRLTNKSPHDAQVHKWWQGAKIQPRGLSIQMTHSVSKADVFFTKNTKDIHCQIYIFMIN